MREVDGIERLIAALPTLDRGGWIFTARRSDRQTAETIAAATFLFADDADEEIDMEEAYPTFLEVQTFAAVVELEAEAGRTGPLDVAAGCLHYLEMDTFRD